VTEAERVDDPFAAVHRSARRRRALVTTVVALGLAAAIATTWVLPGHAATPLAPVAAAMGDAAEPPAASAPVREATEPSLPAGPPTVAEAASASPAVLASAAPVPPPTGAEGVVPPPEEVPAESGLPIERYDVHVDTSGYQAELDRCLWVRMDIGATAPIIGAHNTCGGDVVLDMQIGDSVRLSGEGVDGSYVVVGARDARRGQNAFDATEGMSAAVILQTCHWEGDGVRLLALVPV
jgi:hypothetical protein